MASRLARFACMALPRLNRLTVKHETPMRHDLARAGAHYAARDQAQKSG
jgi:hypothetical protein